jgi:membrane fusion protein, multidrug efflux system
MTFVRLLSSLTLVVLLAGCGRHSNTEVLPPYVLPIAKVRLATAQTENWPAVIEVTGLIRPVQRAQLAAKVMGAIEDLPVTLGQRVRAGDLLAKIGAGEISARLVQAQSQLNAARRDLERERALLTKGASTGEMVKGLEDRFVGAEAMTREAEVMLGYATIRAPFDGVIAQKFANAGDFASPGFPLLAIEGAADFQVEASVPDSLADRLVPGAELAIAVPATGVTFNGRIAELSSAADNAHTVLAKIDVPANISVRSGQFARVQVPGASVVTTLVPTSAVSQLGQMERVFVATENNRAVLRFVKTGAARGDRIEILSGLDRGERVVLAPAALREGQPLEVLP